ncbi:hypothetical protein A2U01_0044116, partial [Trifolium medium]|nr:hypothetical protein [Trifolium medium]
METRTTAGSWRSTLRPLGLMDRVSETVVTVEGTNRGFTLVGGRWRYRCSKVMMHMVGWFVWKRYFRLYDVREHDKLDAIIIAMEEKALNWFQWWEDQTPLRTWEEFKAAV